MVKQLTFPNGRAVLNGKGHEILDPTPMSLPVGFERPEPLQTLIRRLVTDPQIREALTSNELETFDEADDFEIPDDVPVSPHEDNFDPLHLLSREQEINSGTVRSRTPDEVAAARKVLKEWREANKKASAASPIVAPAPEKA